MEQPQPLFLSYIRPHKLVTSQRMASSLDEEHHGRGWNWYNHFKNYSVQGALGIVTTERGVLIVIYSIFQIGAQIFPSSDSTTLRAAPMQRQCFNRKITCWMVCSPEALSYTCCWLLCYISCSGFCAMCVWNGLYATLHGVSLVSCIGLRALLLMIMQFLTCITS